MILINNKYYMDKYITSHRFDLMAKYLYLKYPKNNFYKNMYKKHIFTLNDAWEHPGKKKCINDYLKSFDELKISIKKKGFYNNKPITIGKNGVIINGAHRLAVCLYYKIKPIFKYSDRDGCELYNYNFFLNRNNFWKRTNKIYNNLETIYTDIMALEYVNLKNYIYPIIFYPICYKIFEKNKDEIIKILNNYGNIFYYKKKIFNKNQLKNFIKELYRGEDWVGGLFPNDNCGGKLDLCYSNDYTQLYLFEFNNQNDIITMKQEIRNILNLEKNSLHIPDTKEESFRISSAFLNDNNEIFLNYNFNDDEIKKMKQLFQKYKRDRKLCWDLEENISVVDSRIIDNPNFYFYFNGYKIKIFNSLLDELNGIQLINTKDKINLKNYDLNILEKNKNFLDKALSYYYSDDLYIKYFGKTFLSRYYTFKYCVDNIKKNNPIIVELGTTRSFVDGRFEGCNSDDINFWEPNNPEKWDWSAGCFTKVFSNTFPNSDFNTVDISKIHLKRSKIMNLNCKNITYHCCPSIEFLNNFNKKIDLLYIDTGDIMPIEQNAELQLSEAKIIVEKDLISKNGLILIDNIKNLNPKINEEKSNLGKGKYSIPYLLKKNFEIKMDEYQVILQKKKIN